MIRAARRFALAACVAAALPVASAAATPPTTVVEPFDEVEVVPAGAVCAFEVLVHHEGTQITTTFYDSDGTPIRRLIRWGEHFTETYSANGKSLTTISIAVAHVDLTTGHAAATGTQRHVTAPGFGLIYARSGRDVIVLGTGEVLSFSGVDVPPGSEICAALSP